MESEGVIADPHDYWNDGDPFEPSASAVQEEPTFETIQEQKILRKKAKRAKQRARQAEKSAADYGALVHGQVHHPAINDRNIHPDGDMEDVANESDAIDSETIAKTAKERRKEKAKAKKLRKKERAKAERMQKLEGERAKAVQRKADAKAKGGYVVYSEDELGPYLRYPHLYCERLFQKPVKLAQTLSFLDLPAEIRNMICKHALALTAPIELWPETGGVYADQEQRRRNALILKKKFRTKGSHNLGLLRTCKQVNAEATQIFYGKNEFRFSGVNGHMAAYDFITKIRRWNMNLLRSITIAMPLCTSDRGHYAENWNPTTWRHIDEVYDRRPFPYPWKTWWCRRRFPRLGFRESWCELTWKLAHAHGLQSITFVFPEYEEGFVHPSFSLHVQGLSPIDDIVAAKPFIELAVARMFKATRDVTSPICGSHRALLNFFISLGTCRVRLAIFDPKGNWKLAPQPYVDRRGMFVEDAALDASVQEVDVLPDMVRFFT